MKTLTEQDLLRFSKNSYICGINFKIEYVVANAWTKLIYELLSFEFAKKLQMVGGSRNPIFLGIPNLNRAIWINNSYRF